MLTRYTPDKLIQWVRLSIAKVDPRKSPKKDWKLRLLLRRSKYNWNNRYTPQDEAIEQSPDFIILPRPYPTAANKYSGRIDILYVVFQDFLPRETWPNLLFIQPW